ncbi:hypothetical protein [Streptomyces litmocidini]|uniref:hypothetical protein n=1 Tax=Streptomyces litmocidini TaxID=67318 RepID=UPI003700564B
MRRRPADRAPLRGTIRTVVVLVGFSDKPTTKTAADLDKLFFSLGAMPHDSVRECYHGVTNGLVDLVGAVHGPYRVPETTGWYAVGDLARVRRSHRANGGGGASARFALPTGRVFDDRTIGAVLHRLPGLPLAAGAESADGGGNPRPSSRRL